MADKKYIVDMFEEIIDNIRETGIIISFIESSGSYTITTTNTLINGWHVTIDSVDYEISNVSTTEFTISGETGIDFTNKSWKALEPFYDYGHIIDIMNKLTIKDGNAINKYQKYPLIALILDIEENHDKGINYIYEFAPRIIILDTTDKNYTSQERYINVFKITLYPIYENLIKNIKDYQNFDFKPTMLLPHKKYDRVFWGNESANGNTATILNDYLDGIDLDFEAIKVKDNPSVCQ